MNEQKTTNINGKNRTLAWPEGYWRRVLDPGGWESWALEPGWPAQILALPRLRGGPQATLNLSFLLCKMEAVTAGTAHVQSTLAPCPVCCEF